MRKLCACGVVLVAMCLAQLAAAQQPLTSALFESFFPGRNAFYTYDSFTSAVAGFPTFGTAGSADDQKREVAAFCAHVFHETGGLVYIEEQNPPVDYYCRVGDAYGCAPGKQYFGRGPLQLSWNYNYKLASASVGYDIWSDPDRVAQDAALAWQTALWFWTTVSPPKPAMHDAILDPAQGFGVTINIINGGEECGKGPNASAQSRIDAFVRFCGQLGVDPGANLSCETLTPYESSMIPGSRRLPF